MPSLSEGASQAHFRQRSQSAALGRQQSATVGFEHRHAKGTLRREYTTAYTTTLPLPVPDKKVLVRRWIVSPKGAIIRAGTGRIRPSPFKNSWLLKLD